MSWNHRARIVLALAGLLAASSLALGGTPAELPGAHDHPLIGRYAGATLQNAASENFAAVRIPGGPGRYGGRNDTLTFDKSTAVEGKVSAYFYIDPKERSALEVFRNHEAALKDAGFTQLFSCEMRACDQALIKGPFSAEAVRSRKWVDQGDPAGSIDRDVRFVSARRTQNGADVFVLVFVAEPNSLWGAPVTVVVVAEPAALESGKVLVASDRLRSALAADGRISLYGIEFETARADLKPGSSPQLAEMARLLQTDPALNVFIVGHTDNVGALDANLALSQRRADAVVATLVGQYHVAAVRLRSRGVASFAPVASNRSEDGRARNRRVELVEQ